MAEDNEAQSDQNPQPARKGGKGKTLIIVVLLVLFLGSAGAAGFFFFRHRNAEKPSAAKEKSHDSDSKDEHSEGEVTEVVELQPFIVNLADRDEPRYLRMTVSLGLAESEEKPDPLFTTKVRNAILAIVTEKTAEQILTVEGKTELRKEMLSAARSAVGKDSVQAIYITDFIVQM